MEAEAEEIQAKMMQAFQQTEPEKRAIDLGGIKLPSFEGAKRQKPVEVVDVIDDT